MDGGTFTIRHDSILSTFKTLSLSLCIFIIIFNFSNGGVFGSLFGTPIINPPQSAILGMHGVIERPVVRNGQVGLFFLSSVTFSSWKCSLLSFNLYLNHLSCSSFIHNLLHCRSWSGRWCTLLSLMITAWLMVVRLSLSLGGFLGLHSNKHSYWYSHSIGQSRTLWKTQGSCSWTSRSDPTIHHQNFHAKRGSKAA